MKHKNILVVGAGITGLALTAMLEKQNVSVDLIERAPDWSRTGYGITIMPTGIRILKKLGLLEKVRSAGTSASELDVMTTEGAPVRTIDLKAGGIDSITLARADLHRILLSAVQATTVQMDTRVVKLRQTKSKVTATFNNGAVKTYDLVVGADGIRSEIRQFIFPKVKPHYTGAAVWTFFLPAGVKLPYKKHVLQVWNDNEFMGIFPFKDSAAITFSAPLDSKLDVTQVDLQKRFNDIHVLAGDILPKVGTKDMYAGYLNEMKLHDWYKGRVLLAGDAAHAMMPATGMGSSMGMADAEAIATLASSCSEDEWEVLPALYQHKRKATADRIQREAYLITKTMFLSGPLKNVRDETIKAVPQFIFSHTLKNL